MYVVVCVCSDVCLYVVVCMSGCVCSGVYEWVCMNGCVYVVVCMSGCGWSGAVVSIVMFDNDECGCLCSGCM